MELILSAVSVKTGIVGRLGGGPINLLMSTNISVGGTNVPARDLLMEVSESMRRKMVWDLWFLPDLRKYALIFREAALAVPGAFGQKRLVPVGPMPALGP